MPFPPIDKTFQGLMQDTLIRLNLVERRLARGTTGGAADLPNRLGGADGDITAIPAGTDLNTVTATGWYIQNVSANATLALNYPVARAGHLEVSGGLFGTGADLIFQTYTEYAPVAPSTVARQWRRTHYNGTWTAWTLVGGVGNILPAAVRYAPGTQHTVAATSWGTMLPGTVAQSITVSQPTWVMVTFGAWLQASAGETRAGVSLGGATVVSPPNTQQDGLVGSGAWGQTLIVQTADVGATSGQRTQQRVYLLGVGTTTFTIEAYLATAGTHQVNYPTLEIVPLYVDASAAALPTAPTVIADVAGVKMCSGSFVIAASVAAGGASGGNTVTFPAGFFSAPPLSIFAMPSNGRLTPSFAALTAASCTVHMNNWSTGATPAGQNVLWTAIGV